jgi:hypothetical protein
MLMGYESDYKRTIEIIAVSPVKKAFEHYLEGVDYHITPQSLKINGTGTVGFTCNCTCELELDRESRYSRTNGESIFPFPFTNEWEAIIYLTEKRDMVRQHENENFRSKLLNMVNGDCSKLMKYQRQYLDTYRVSYLETDTVEKKTTQSCSACHGYGSYPCNVCYGSRPSSCMWCDWDGWRACSICHGTAMVNSTQYITETNTIHLDLDAYVSTQKDYSFCIKGNPDNGLVQHTKYYRDIIASNWHFRPESVCEQPGAPIQFTVQRDIFSRTLDTFINDRKHHIKMSATASIGGHERIYDGDGLFNSIILDINNSIPAKQRTALVNSRLMRIAVEGVNKDTQEFNELIKFRLVTGEALDKLKDIVRDIL